MKKVNAFLLTFVLVINSLNALDLSLRLSPSVLFSGKNTSFETGFGGVAQADVNLFNLLNVGVEGFYNNVPITNSNALSLYGWGLGLGAYYYPLSRLYVGAGGAFGIYSWSTNAVDTNDTGNSKEFIASNLYYRAYGEVGFRFNPSLTVCANGGYAGFMEGSKTSYKGPFAGVSVKINMEVGNKGSGDVGANIEQFDDVYPVYMQLYRTASAGNIILTNYESAEIRNVKVSFRAGKYTASTIECATIPMLQKFKSAEVPLMIDFSNDILNFSENGVISGEVIVEYDFLGKKKINVENVVLSVNNRNAFSWGDSAALAAFISPDTPEVLELAKFCAGVTRNNLYTGMNRNIQFAAGIFEGLKASGITYSGDVSTPYVTYHTGYELDSVQYPLQTMDCLSGDYDDLGVLLAACLESVGIPTALIPYDDDFLVLVSIDVKPNQALNHFASEDSVLVDDSDVYFALSMANFEKGFTVSRKVGSEKLALCKTDETGKYEYINIHTAWELYPPVVYSSGSSSFEKPSQTVIEKATADAIKEYIDGELSVVIENARKSGNDNKVGVALVRAGRYSEAKDAFNRAAKSGSLAAMNNVANVLMYEKNYSAAAAQYQKVLDKDPENNTAKKGLENANSKLED